MPASTRQKWANQPESLRETLLYHIIPKHVSAFGNEETHETLLANSAALDLFEIGSSKISRSTWSHHLRINIYPSTNNLTTDFDVSEVRIVYTLLRLNHTRHFSYFNVLNFILLRSLKVMLSNFMLMIDFFFL